MAIKINGKDLAKRIINWQEVQKVMLNGYQIRPSTSPSYLYIPWDFTNSSLPSDWRIYSGSSVAEFTTNWLTKNDASVYSIVGLWTRGNWISVPYVFTLTDAIKIKSIQEWYLEPSEIANDRSTVTVWWWRATNIIVPWNELRTFLYYSKQSHERTMFVQANETIDHATMYRIWSLSGDWVYTLTTETDLNTWELSFTVSWPNWFSQSMTDTLSSADIAAIKTCTNAIATINYWATLAHHDLYIRY